MQNITKSQPAVSNAFDLQKIENKQLSITEIKHKLKQKALTAMENTNYSKKSKRCDGFTEKKTQNNI